MKSQFINYKEEAINEFGKQIKENNVFKNVISEQQIEEILEENIESVYYKEINAEGRYNPKRKSIEIGYNEEENVQQNALTHETLHSLSDRGENGIGFLTRYGKNERGRGLTEGITEYLTEKIRGRKSNNYPIEKSTYAILEHFADRESFLYDYIYGTNRAEAKIWKKHGSTVVNMYKEVITLLDKITIANISYGNIDVKSETYELEAKNIINTVISVKKALDRVLDKMISLYLEKSDNFLEDGILLNLASEYPGAENFKEFNLKEEKEKCKNKMDNWLGLMILKETNEVSTSQINKQTQQIKETIELEKEPKKNIIQKEDTNEGNEI